MKAMKTIVAVMAAAVLATAQTPSTNKPKAPASQMVSGAPAAAPSAAPAKTPAKKHQAEKKHAAAAPASTPMHPPAPRAKKPVVNAVAKAPAGVPEKPAAPKTAAGKRDPFVNPVVRASATGAGSMCSTGKRCLAINEVVLRGVVKTQSGMIAVVSNQANRAYFLKENDPVFNGTVLKITADSVIFRETVLDNLGRETTREVVKRVTAPPV